MCAHETHGYNIYRRRYKTAKGYSGLLMSHIEDRMFLWDTGSHGDEWGRGKLLINEVGSPPREEKLQVKQVQIIQKILIGR